MKYTQDITFQEKAVVENDVVKVAVGHMFVCSAPCGFVSSGWATEEAAKERAVQHATEHKTNEPMPEMAEFIGDRHEELVMASVIQRGKK